MKIIDKPSTLFLLLFCYQLLAIEYPYLDSLTATIIPPYSRTQPNSRHQRLYTIHQRATQAYLWSRLLPLQFLVQDSKEVRAKRYTILGIKISAVSLALSSEYWYYKELQKYKTTVDEAIPDSLVVSDTLLQYKAYLSQTIRINDRIANNIELIRNPFLIGKSSLRLKASSAHSAYIEARRLQSDAQDMFRKAHRLRRLSTILLITSISVTGGASLYLQKNPEKEVAILPWSIPTGYALYACSVPPRLVSEKLFHKGLRKLDKDIRSNYPLLQ